VDNKALEERLLRYKKEKELLRRMLAGVCSEITKMEFRLWKDKK